MPWAAPIATIAIVFAFAATPAAANPLGLGDCGVDEGVYQCSGLVKTWDGVPLDTTVTLPHKDARGLPLVAELHGFGNSKYEYLDPASTAYTDNAFDWARDGYAVLTFTDRGLWGSCGTPESRLARPTACAHGYIHLADTRYEVRDAQELIGRLVDGGYVAPERIGVTGDSYGGGQTLALAALANRVMLPDGSLVPWRTPNGTPLRVAAAAPVIPWSDLITAAAPNGRVSATGITGLRRATQPVGVAKSSFINGIFAAAQTAQGPGQPVGQPFIQGRPMGYLAPSGADPQADVAGWVARTDAGEPYDDQSAQRIVSLLTRFHSAYYIHPRRPPPLFIAAGFTDDLFPVDESLRFVNRTAARYPSLPVSLLLGDLGHQRAANKPVERERLLADIHRWFDRHLKGEGPGVPDGVTAYIETCPRTRPSLGPFHALDFATLAPDRARFASTRPQTVRSGGGDPQVALAVDPVAGGGDSCATLDAAKAPGTARYTVAQPSDRAITLLGAPRLRARLDVGGVAPRNAELVARLWDVSGGKEQLVARGTYRPSQGRNSWQLHPGAWRFEPGHAAVLELLGSDAPYARPANSAFSIEVKRLRCALPVR